MCNNFNNLKNLINVNQTYVLLRILRLYYSHIWIGSAIFIKIRNSFHNSKSFFKFVIKVSGFLACHKLIWLGVTQSVLLVVGFNLNNFVKIRNSFHNSKYFYKYFLFSCGDRNRTYYQWVMSPKCNHYTSPRCMLKNFFFFD